MTRFSVGLLLLIVLIQPCLAGTVTEKDFEVKTTKNLLNLCTVSHDNPLYHHAVNFCHGYLVGAFHYYEASTSGPKGIKLVCLPNPHPSRNDAIAMFIGWAKSHPEYLGENAVGTRCRFLMEKWPCKD